MGKKYDYDLIILGSGPAGVQASVQAAKLKKKVCIIEASREEIGGAWIHWGTLPSKTFRESLAAIHSISEHAGAEWVDRIIIDLQTGKLMERAKKVSKFDQDHVYDYLTKNDIEVVWGSGRLESKHEVTVDRGEQTQLRLKGECILISTGSRPRRPPEIPFDGWRIVDADDVLNLKQIPRSMVIYGAGVIGCEYACIFNALGVHTTVLDKNPAIMSYFDQEVVGELRRSMEAAGVHFHLGGGEAKNVRVDGPKVLFDYDDQTLTTDCFFFCAGRMPQTGKLGAEELGVRLDARGHIQVNKRFQTDVPNIYAAGDVIGSPALAATSMAQGRLASCHAFNAETTEFPEIYPFGVYTMPEMSLVGKTEADLDKEGQEYVVGRAYYREIARGNIRGDKTGLMKILVDKKTHRLLGVHIVGEDACNLVHIGQALMSKGGYAQDIIDTVFNYPTLTEGYRIAAFNALNKIFPDGNIGAPPQRAKKAT